MRVHHMGQGLAGLLVSWQAVVWLIAPPRYILPSPLEVVSALVRRSAFLLEHMLVTVTEIAVGLAFGTVLGAASALLVAALPRFGRVLWPMILVLQAFPVFVLAPILVLWLGFGMASKVAMTTIIIFFPVASAFADGLRRTDAVILDAVALTRATNWQALRYIRAPLALPGLISGLRVAAPLAPLGAIIGEWVGASAGLGFVMVQANARMQTDVVFAAMAILALLTLLLRFLVERLTAGWVPWAMENETRHLSPRSRRTSL